MCCIRSFLSRLRYVRYLKGGGGCILRTINKSGGGVNMSGGVDTTFGQVCYHGTKLWVGPEDLS